MGTPSDALEGLFAEARPLAQGGARPPRMRYSHDAMVDIIVQNPWITQNDIAAHFGYTPAWVSTIITSDAFQAKLAARREEVIDPVMKATLEERFRGLVHRSMEVLMQKLSKPVEAIPDNVALRALELGARGIELGGFGRPQMAPPPAPPEGRLEELAKRLVEIQDNVRKGVTYENAEIVEEVPAAGEASGEFQGSGLVRSESVEGTVRALGEGTGEAAL